MDLYIFLFRTEKSDSSMVECEFRGVCLINEILVWLALSIREYSIENNIVSHVQRFYSE